MRVLVTGATGFVGKHLLATLVIQGHEVRALVRGAPPQNPSVAATQVGEIDGDTDWSNHLAGADAIVHLAARVHVLRELTADSDSAYNRVNADGTLSLARAARAQGVGRFVFVSSIKVNGERTRGEAFTTASSPSPMDSYGRSKLCAEVGLQELAGAGNLDVVVLRPPVVYGAGVGGNIRRLATAVQWGLPLPLGAVNNARTLISVGNLVTGIMAALETPDPPRAPVLVGDPTPVSTRDLVLHMATGMRRPSRLVKVPIRSLRMVGQVLGRGSEVARLVDDLRIEPAWAALGVSESKVAPAERELIAFGRAFALEGRAR